MMILSEEKKEGLLSLMDQVITVFACRYIYTGRLVGVNDTCVKLEDPEIVYETGPFDNTNWSDAQALPHKHFYVSTGAIESFGLLK